MITSHTFAERLYNCSNFKEEKNYGSIIQKLTMEIINESIDSRKDNDNVSIFTLLYQKFIESKTLRLVMKEDKELVEDIIIAYAENMSYILNKFNLNFTDVYYEYRYKIYGNIFGVLEGDHNYNFDISYRSPTDTFYHLYYYKLNFFLYNKTYNTKRDGLVFILSNKTVYYIPYNEDDYTINRGFLDYNIKNRAVRPGHQCLYCSVKNCKPRLITNIDRFLI